MKGFYEFMYKNAKDPENLPWHRDNIPPPLETAIEQIKGGKALDLGCGTGVYATFLAEKGFTVTAIDFVPKALAMARQRAELKHVAINFVEANILEWQADTTFDLIFDSGCLHGIDNTTQRNSYKHHLLEWLAPRGAFVLSHFCRRYFLDWRPMGPRRKTRTEINDLFAPELVERNYWDELVPTALPVGPIVKFGHYLFERAG
jgi:2-polyprenyl-3-methyl-5-hydroxy-6-metoxy-1,4-benzoquinol methylase